MNLIASAFFQINSRIGFGAAITSDKSLIQVPGDPWIPGDPGKPLSPGIPKPAGPGSP